MLECACNPIHMNKSKITSFQILDHGIEHAQYFQGCGVSHTDFEHVATGCGHNLLEALDDAIEQIAQTHDIESFEAIEKTSDYRWAHSKKGQRETVTKWARDTKAIKRNAELPEESELYCYASIRYNIGVSDERADIAAGLHRSQIGYEPCKVLFGTFNGSNYTPEMGHGSLTYRANPLGYTGLSGTFSRTELKERAGDAPVFDVTHLDSAKLSAFFRALDLPLLERCAAIRAAGVPTL